MKVEFLTQHEDGSQAYAVVLDKDEVKVLTQYKEEFEAPSLSEALQAAIEVGIEL